MSIGWRASMALLLTSMPMVAIAQDRDAGSVLFRQRCQSCHGVKPGQTSVLGPNLAGVTGRKAASTGFAYSSALKSSGLTWDKSTLDMFLAAPMTKVPGTRMIISVADARQRADLLAFLAAQKP
ncbi:c-type cytochrome [Sphingobium sp. AP49]|uniref:c-type cytochrome n=1 Tax=Sphingobium sp. AP49 TaxID=1144307 RepID=UPI00026ED103|nr:c-type cytochrome [Sphingobium sp. AP49]WHO37309.1 c-type cytochrome [Sphingobium sp. AP49]